jgi:glutaredoxin
MVRAAFFVSVLSISWLAFASPAESAKPGVEDAAQAKQAKVSMYVMPDCGYCEKARVYLREQGVAFEELDIAASVEHKTAWRALGGQGTPLIVIGKQHVQGFDADKISKLLVEEKPVDINAQSQ